MKNAWHGKKEIQVLHDGIRILSRAIDDHAIRNENYARLHQCSVGLQLLDACELESLDEKEKHTRKAENPSMVQYMELVKKCVLDFTQMSWVKKKMAVLMAP